MPAYDLVVPKNILKGNVVGPQVSMGALADILSRQTGRPVKDATGIAGLFDIRLNWTPDDMTGKDMASDAPSI
jgi:uncharacterized protein (TIGR03435 family)